MYHLYNCAILPPPAESSASHTCLTIRQCALRLWIIIDVLTEYHGIARGSPCVVPSCESISPLLQINNLDGLLKVFACTVASAPALWPAQTCRGPATSFISSFKKPFIIFPTISLRTSPTLICQIPGFLSSGMSPQDVKVLSKDGWYNFLSRFLVNTTISSLRILPSVLKFLEHRILLYSSKSIHDGLALFQKETPHNRADLVWFCFDLWLLY